MVGQSNKDNVCRRLIFDDEKIKIVNNTLHVNEKLEHLDDKYYNGVVQPLTHWCTPALTMEKEVNHHSIQKKCKFGSNI